MKIYYLRANVDDYNWLNLTKDSDFQKLDLFDGRTLINNWIPFDVEVVKGRKRKWSDVTSIAPAVITIPQKTKQIIEIFIRDKVEFLPLPYDSQDYYIINVINVINALDKEKSEYETFRDGRLMDVCRYEFKSDVVRGQNIFKIPEFNLSYVYVSDEFKRLVEENGLIGFEFEELWDSED